MDNKLMKSESTMVAVAAMQEWAVMKEQAQVMLKSGFLPPSIKTAEQCLAIFLTGKELGIGFMEAIRSVHVIQGKPTISPQLMLALANRTHELEDQKIDATNKRAVVTIKRKNRSAHTVEFGETEAAALGLTSKDNYRKQPKTMYQWRALAAALRVTFPDVLLGMYTPEELGAEVKVNDEGEMTVEADVVKTETTPQANPPQEPAAEAIPDQDLIIVKVEQKEGKLNGKTVTCWIAEDVEGAKVYTWDEKIGLILKEASLRRCHAKALTRQTKSGTEVLSAVLIKPTLLSTSEQKTLHNLCIEKGVSWDDFRKFIHDQYGAINPSDIRSQDYNAVYEWIIKAEKPRKALS